MLQMTAIQLLILNLIFLQLFKFEAGDMFDNYFGFVRQFKNGLF
jgi:hypothetical protein